MARKKLGKRDDDLHMLVKEELQDLQPATIPKRNKVARVTPDIKETALEVIKTAFEQDKAGLQKLEERMRRRQIPMASIYEAFRNFEEAIGGRGKLMDVLAHCPPNSQGYAMLARMIEDPEFAPIAQANGEEEQVKFTLAALCSKHKVPFPTLVACFKDAQLAKLYVESLNQISDQTPVIVHQMAEDATNRWIDCIQCDATGRVQVIEDGGVWKVDKDGEPVTVICYTCRGKGKVWQSHDIQNRKLFLETVGISKKDPLVQQNFDQRSVSVSVPGENFEKVMLSIDTLIRTSGAKDLASGGGPLEDEPIDV
jgi:hypothetical protein